MLDKGASVSISTFLGNFSTRGFCSLPYGLSAKKSPLGFTNVLVEVARYRRLTCTHKLATSTPINLSLVDKSGAFIFLGRNDPNAVSV